MNFKQALADASRQGSAERLEVITLNDYIDLVAERPRSLPPRTSACTT